MRTLVALWSLLRLRAAPVAFAALACVSLAVRAADDWPDVKVPGNASVEAIASDMVLNGKQSRMLRFQAHASEQEVTTFYRNEFGAKRVENRMKDDQVIATRQGDYFITVQLHARDSQTVDGIAMTTLISGKPVSSAVLIDTKKLLPSDTQVVSSVQTSDDGKRSVMVVGMNRNSVRANLEHVVEAMAERGFRLTKQDGPSDAKEVGSVSIQLASPGEEASVTIADAGAYRSVVINRIRGAK